jgi:hypothetical protein
MAYLTVRTSNPDLAALRQKRLRLLAALRVVHLAREMLFRRHLAVRFIVGSAKKLSAFPFRDRFSAAAL